MSNKILKKHSIPSINENKKVLLIGSRKVSRLHKLLMLDLERLIPHVCKERKIERKQQLKQI